MADRPPLTVGDLVTFVRHDPDERPSLSSFRRGDRLRLDRLDAAPDGYVATRLRDGQTDLVWLTEVRRSRVSHLPDPVTEDIDLTIRDVHLVRIERMDDDTIWMEVTGKDGRTTTINLVAKGDVLTHRVSNG
jgi:hypothetical protein